MSFYQIHGIERHQVDLLDICAKKKVSASLSDDNQRILLNLSNDSIETIKGVHKCHCDLAPISVGGRPYVYASGKQDKFGLICPIEEQLEMVETINDLEIGDFLITE